MMEVSPSTPPNRPVFNGESRPLPISTSSPSMRQKEPPQLPVFHPSLSTRRPVKSQESSKKFSQKVTENNESVSKVVRKESHLTGLKAFAHLPKEPRVDLLTLKGTDIPTEEQFNQTLCYRKVNFDLTKWNSKRNRIAYEIYTTEETYVKGLQLALIMFRNPIKAAFDNNQLDQSYAPLIHLFEVMNIIENINNTLFQALRQRFENWSEEQLLGDVIETLTPFLKMYRQYTQIYDSALVSISAPKNNYWKMIMEKASNHQLTAKNMIGSYLILPVQRIPRYILLLRDLISQTPESHPDLQNLNSALELMKNVTADINDAIKQAESSTKCLAVLQSFIDPPELSKLGSKGMLPKFIKHGIIMKQCRKARKERVFVLFAKALVYATTIPGMDQWKLSFVSDSTQVSCESVFDDPKFNIINAITIKSKKKSFMIFTPTKQEKEEWIQAFKSIGLYEKPGEYAPVWIPDEAVSHCKLCDDEFGMLLRRHHCRSCGDIICASCSEKKMKVIISDNPERVCDYCFDKKKAETKEDDRLSVEN